MVSELAADVKLVMLHIGVVFLNRLSGGIMAKPLRCFVVGPIGEDGSDTRTRSDQVLRHVVKPVASDKGYTVLRGDELGATGNITAQVLQEIATADLVIADLSGHNPNVFYELALRHALNLPIIQIIARGEPIPFDVGQTRTIRFNYQDLDDVDRCKQELEKQIDNITENPAETGSPIATVLGALEISAGKDPLSKVNLEIMERLGNLTEQFGHLSTDLLNNRDPESEPFAEYIEGQENAFAALTKVTKSARDTIRSSRYGPESVLAQTEYVSAIEQRVNGTDGRPPLKHYYRIVAVNNSSKQKDVNHHLNSFCGRPFILYLTAHQNSFELVVVDETDVFIHFYKEEKVIASSLHLRGSRIANEFIEIFDRLTERDLLQKYDCQHIQLRSVPFTDVAEIFSGHVKQIGLVTSNSKPGAPETDSRTKAMGEKSRQTSDHG